MIDKVWKSINEFNMLKDVETLILGVSGGIDSISLLHFFVKNTDLDIKVAHVNHNLRGNESLRDENFVREICELWNVEFILGSFDVSGFSKQKKKGIEESAREIRYKFFNELSSKYNSKIATAHNLSDNLETIIFNLTRGSGLSGLCGIPPVRDNIIRPLIYVTRSEIESYASKNNLRYVTDSSNLSDAYSRNKIRHNIIPKLKEINSSFEKNSLRCILQIRDENEFLSSIANEKFKDVNFECYKIKLLPKVIKKRVLKLILNTFDTNIEYKHIELANLLLDGKLNSFSLSKSKKILIKNGKIVCENKKSQNLSKNFFISKLKKEDLNSLDNFKNIFGFNGKISDFEFRTRKPGDIFRLPNRNCSKSLKKLFNELRIPTEERVSLKILENKLHGDIVWIESIGVSEKYQVSDANSFIGKISILIDKVVNNV